MTATSSALARAHLAVRGAGGSTGSGRRDLTERAEEDVRDRAVHRAAHHDRQQRARRADQHAAHDQHVVLELETGRRRGEAGERVQQRDHDGHVGAADRQHEQHPEQRRAGDRAQISHCCSAPAAIAMPAASTPQTGARSSPAAADRRSDVRRISSCNFANATIEPENEMLPMIAESMIAMLMSHFSVPGSRCAVVELRQRDQRRRPAPDAVEERNHLRHRRHVHLPRSHQAEGAADRHADGDLPVAHDLVLRERDDDRDQHSGGADLVPSPRGRGIRQEAQRQDERHDRDQVEKVRDLAAQESRGFSAAPAS